MSWQKGGSGASTPLGCIRTKASPRRRNTTRLTPVSCSDMAQILPNVGLANAISVGSLVNDTRIHLISARLTGDTKTRDAHRRESAASYVNL